MTVRLKVGVVLNDSDNHQNLQLNQWERLNAGEAVELEVLPEALAEHVEIVQED